MTPEAATPSDSALASTAQQVAAPVAAPSPTGPCTTNGCIITDAKTMVGDVAKDESVLTKMTCKQSTVKQPTPGVYTVHCTSTYSDGSVYAGVASVLILQDKVAWEPTETISYGDGQ